MPQTLLLADDSVTIQRVIELTFADEDVEVVAVSDGDSAIARIDAQPPDIVLADVGMTGKNGYEVAQHMKQSPRLAHIPVILLTGAFEPVDQVRADAAGCEGVLAKPFEPQLVISRVKELLAKIQRPQPVPAAASETVRQAAPDHARHAFWPPEPPAPAPKVPKAAEDLDSYFDRLDQAFAGLDAPAPVRLAPDVDGPGAGRNQPVEASAGHDHALSSSATDADFPLSFASPRSEFDRETEEVNPPHPDVRAAVDSAPPPSSPAGLPAAPPAGATASAPHKAVHAEVALPPLADAFAALLASEQQVEAPGAAPQWPASGVTVAIRDDVIEEIAQRVLDRLSDQVGRETVSRVVSAIAERLVREEIERIKNSIK